MRSEFAARLRALREEANLSQADLERKIGISKSSINMYERGEREPGFEKLEIIADYFNVDMDYLLGKSDIRNYFQALRQVEATLEMSDQDPQIIRLLGYAQQLNAKGLERVNQYAEETSQQPQYQKNPPLDMAARGGKVVKLDKPVDTDALIQGLSQLEPTENR